MVALAGLLGAQAGQPSSLAEYEIKAAFIYNFAKFVQWPDETFEQPRSPLVVCLIGQDNFGAALESIDHKIAQGREVQVLRLVRLDDVRSCHILFISESERSRLATLLHAVAGAHVLTISDLDHFAEAGGMIGLYSLDDRIQFSINLQAAQGASLKISSQLLKLARIVQHDVREDRP
jgi:hypothetical protein